MQYRIVRDGFLGYEVQARHWWWPFWMQVGFNSHPSEEHAVEFIKRRRYCRRVVFT